MTDRASKSARTGIFGGSFNPPHVAHLIVAEVIREQFGLDRIVWIPSCQSPHKRPEELAPANDRLEMTRLAVRGNDGFEVSEIELRRGGVSYTVDTIRTLQEEHPDAAYNLILGADALRDFASWKKPRDILDRVSLIVFRRAGVVPASLPAEFEPRVTYAEAPLIDVSSSTIRERLHSGRSIRYMVPDAVRAYVTDRGLYRLQSRSDI